jgi:quercetin dioxygenase-like cupin family protein
MLRAMFSVLVLLAVAVWLGYPLVRRSPTSPSNAHYRVVVKSSYQGRNFVVRDTTIAPGGRIGWHWHRGTVIAVIKQGFLSHYRDDCTVDAVYGPGDSYVEASGPDHVHDGRNLGTTPVVLEVMYIIPAGTPLADASKPPSRCQ